MLSKIERFQQWRGSKFDTEQHVLNSALLISDCVNSVDNLEAIKASAEIKFKDFNQHKARSWGTVAFAKLFIDEAIEQLPDSADTEKALLTHSTTILKDLYDNWKDDTSKNILALIENIEKLLIIEKIPFADKKQYKAFILSSCMLFHLIRISLDQMDWASQMIAALIVNIDQMKLKIANFLQMLEEKAKQLELLEQIKPRPDKEESDPLKLSKDLLNKRYLRVLRGSSLIVENPKRTRIFQDPKFHAPQVIKIQHAEKKTVRREILASLTELEMDIAKISSGISSLLDLRSKKEGIEARIHAVKKFLSDSETNDRKITGRTCFLDFVESHAELYQIILENTEETRRAQFLEKTRQLKIAVESPDLSTGIINTASWVATPLTLVYRTATPQLVQDMFSANLPSTLEGVCNAELKQLAKIYLDDLHHQLKKKEKQISAVNNRFFHQDEALKQLIANESSERLAILNKANDVMKDAVQASRKLLVTVKENLHFLNNLKEKSDTLNEFITLHDGFLVKISNFLARFFPCFKTETAKMIDKASDFRSQVDTLALEYRNAVDQGIDYIESNPDLDESIKLQLKRQFDAEEREISLEKQNRVTPNRHNVRLLMNSLSKLFAVNPHPVSEQPIEEEHKMDEAVLVCP